ARPERSAQRGRIARGERLIARRGPFQIARDIAPNAVEYGTHGVPPDAQVWSCVICGEFMSDALHFGSCGGPGPFTLRVRSGTLWKVNCLCLKWFHCSPPMPRISRRTLLIGSASLAATPACAATSPYFDVAIVGAGPAGIAAARRLTAAGR